MSRSSTPARHRAGRCLLLLLSSSGAAQASEPDGMIPEIIIYGERKLLGVSPETILSQGDIAAYGASNLGELLSEIRRERGENDDAPVYLVDGRRIPGLQAMETYPPEILERIQILPAGSGARAGGTASGGRVFNLVLKPRARTSAARMTLGRASAGGFNSGTGEIGFTDVQRPRRINLTLSGRSEGALLESDREIVQPETARPDEGRIRTLRPAFEETELRLSAADRTGGDLEFSATLGLVGSSTRSLLGLGSSGEHLQQRTRRRAAEVKLQLNGAVGGWLVSIDAFHKQDRRQTRTLSGPALRATGTNSMARVSATRSMLDLPAGPLTVTVRAGLRREAVATSAADYVQSTRAFGLDLQVPIAGGQGALIGGIGELSAGLELARKSVREFGKLDSATVSMQWQPARWLRLTGAIGTAETPPDFGLVAAPLLETPGVRRLDPLTGETVEVIELSGGNPELRPEKRTDRRLTVQLRPLRKLPLLLNAEYLSTRERDLVATFADSSEHLLAAFPERIVRDPDGRMVRVDIRPLNFAHGGRDQLRSGLELKVPLRATARERQLRLSLSQTWLLRSELQEREAEEPGQPMGLAAGRSGGMGRPRRQAELMLAYAEKPWGVRLTASHKSASFLRLSPQSGPAVLRFSPVTTYSVRAFADADALLPRSRWGRGLRFGLSVVNLTDRRGRVLSSPSEVPLAFQPAYRDPVGRILQFELRKIL